MFKTTNRFIPKYKVWLWQLDSKMNTDSCDDLEFHFTDIFVMTFYCKTLSGQILYVYVLFIWVFFSVIVHRGKVGPG